MIKPLGRVMAAATCLLLVATAHGASGQQAVRIGFQAGLSGPAAADGATALKAARLAVEQINADGGVEGRPLELVVADDQGELERAVLGASRLVSEGVKAVVSASFSGPARAAAPVFQRAGIPFVASVAFAPEITHIGNAMFRMTSVGEVQGRAAAALVGERLRKKRAVVLTIKTDFGKTLAAGFRDAAPRFGIDIVGEYEYAPADRQFGPLIASLKSKSPDVVYVTGFYFTAGPFVAQLRNAGVKAQVVGAEALSSQQFIDIAGSAAEGTVITNVIDWGSDDPATQRFLTHYKAATGANAEAVAVSTYTAVTLVASAIRQGRSDSPARIRSELETIDQTTVIGRVSFNALHEVKKAFPLSIVRDRRWQGFGQIDDPELLAPPTR
ncbi:ABC transporter substrate-binding protein [Pandoraea anhela]|uniref:Branched chain amino acid ABC transporter substrate-binding protein n=1 Tax=Pandoraea anhela TaxID=2508295 RepID=A0A5E4X3J7_9BURK|nr:ABC transporter substrate-binding protein [Pandoraea anhela]VVE30931.1 branched chain amino acid ABC transporter substrate-binding protein [Pandoraea anhela]